MSKLYPFLNTFHSHHLLIFFIPFLIYLTNGREISSGDPTPTVFVAINLVKQGSYYLDDLNQYIGYGSLPYYVSEQKGHILSNYPIFPGIMASPIFAPFVWLGMLEPGDGDLVWRYLAKLSGALFTALSVYFMYLALCMLISKHAALGLAYSYGLGTALWPIASQSLWQHGPSVMWWSVMLYALIRYFESKNTRVEFWLLLAGCAAGCAVLCRVVNGIGLAWISFILLIFLGKKSFYFIVPASVVTFMLLLYNFYYFESWKGGLEYLLTLQWELDRVEAGRWSTPLWIGLSGQLISPSRGIFIFSPFLVFAFLGMLTIWYKQQYRPTNAEHSIASISAWRFIALTIPIPVIMLLLFSKYSVWWGGNSHYGPRYQIETYPFLMMFIAAYWEQIHQSKTKLTIFILLLVIGVTVQFIGAFCYPSTWATEPTLIWEDKDRYWDYSYNQIITCARSGIKFPW